MPTRELMSPDGQVISDEMVEQGIDQMVAVACEAIDDSGRDVAEHTRAAIKKHVAIRLGEYFRRVMR